MYLVARLDELMGIVATIDADRPSIGKRWRGPMRQMARQERSNGPVAGSPGGRSSERREVSECASQRA